MGDDDDDDDEEEVDEDEEGNMNLPQVFIMNQIAQIKEIVNMDDIEGTVQKVIDEYLLRLRIQRGDVMPELHDDVEEDDDDEEDDQDDEDEDNQQEKGKTDL